MSDLEQHINAVVTRRVRAGFWFNILGGVLLLLASGMVCVLTFWFTYLVLAVGFDWLFHFRHRTRMALSGLFLPLLFWGNARTDRGYLSEYSVSTLDGGPPVSFWIPQAGLVSNVNFFASGTIHSAAKLITDLLYTGPRLAVAAWRAWQRAARLRKVQVPGCAAILTLLLAHKGRVPLATIIQSLPDLNLPELMPQLGDLEGVVFLNSEPPGMSLTLDLRTELMGEYLKLAGRF